MVAYGHLGEDMGKVTGRTCRNRAKPLLALGDYLVVACIVSQARLTMQKVSSPNAKAMDLEFELRLEGMFGEEAGNI